MRGGASSCGGGGEGTIALRLGSSPELGSNRSRKHGGVWIESGREGGTTQVSNPGVLKCRRFLFPITFRRFRGATDSTWYLVDFGAAEFRALELALPRPTASRLARTAADSSLKRLALSYCPTAAVTARCRSLALPTRSSSPPRSTPR